jgi:hypothetical protein
MWIIVERSFSPIRFEFPEFFLHNPVVDHLFDKIVVVVIVIVIIIFIIMNFAVSGR